MNIPLAQTVLADTIGEMVFDNYCNRYRLSFRQVKETQLQKWLQEVRLGGGSYDIASFRNEVNDLFKESFVPHSYSRSIRYSITLSDMVVGELFRLRAPHPSAFFLEAMVYNASSLLILKDSTGIKKPGDIVLVPQKIDLKDFLCRIFDAPVSEVELFAVIPGQFHRALDSVLLPQLHCKKSASTLMPLYEMLVECARQKQFCQEFKNICDLAMESGFSTFTIRTLVDMLTQKQSEDEA